MRVDTPNSEYRRYCIADRPNHVDILSRAAETTDGFGVLTQATVSPTVEEAIAELDVPVIADCGVFADDSFDGSLIELFDTYERMNADYGLIPDVLGDRRQTDKSVSLGSRQWRRGCPRWSFDPVAVAQGETPAEYASAYWDCYQLGADRIAIGGLLSTDGEQSGRHATATDEVFTIIDRIRSTHPRIWDETWTFALGCDHPRRRPRFETAGVQGADSKRWLFQYDNSLPMDRADQLVNTVVQSTQHKTATLSQDYTDPKSQKSDPGR